MNSHDVLIRDLMNIKRWYLTTIYSYKKTCLKLTSDIEENIIDNIDIDIAYGENNSNPVALLRRLSVDNLKICKELALIKIISTLEVFLVSSIIEVFRNNKKPFMIQDKIDIHISEMLSYKDIDSLHESFINKKCRQLHSQGFDEIRKYYKRILSVDFSNFHNTCNGVTVNINLIKKYHDMRHLIIHQMGNTDAHYRKTYNTDSLTISMSHDEIILFFDASMAFSNYINKNLDLFITTPKIDNVVKICIDLLESDPFMIEPDYTIFKKKGSFQLSSILHGIEYDLINPNIVTISLQGEYPQIRQYYKNLQRIMSKGIIKILAYDVSGLDLQWVKVPRKSYPISDIQKVINELPEKPWPKGIHKEIASKLGWSNGKVSNIITLLITEQEFQVNIEKKEITLSVGEEYKINASVTPPENKVKIRWISESPSIVKVENGHLHALAPGETVVSAIVNAKKKKEVCKVKVI